MSSSKEEEITIWLQETRSRQRKN